MIMYHILFINSSPRRSIRPPSNLLKTAQRGDKAAAALLAAWRFREGHDLLKKVTARPDAAASDWLLRGQAAIDSGYADDALTAYRRALELDPKAVVPDYAREGKKK